MKGNRISGKNTENLLTQDLLEKFDVEVAL